MRKYVLGVMVLVMAACGFVATKVEPARITVFTVVRRDIEVYADAAGNIEAVNIVDVKSKAGGQILKLNVETGSYVQKGDTLAQLDTKEVDQVVLQAEFDTLSAYQTYMNDVAERERQTKLYEQRVITKIAYDAGALTVTRSLNNLNKARSALDQAKTRQSDATVLAPITGTIIGKSVSEGQVVQGSSNATSAGTTLLQMTDLSQLRVRVSFNEVDISNVDTGMTATILVDALPDEQIIGRIIKIEPIAQQQQSVTMFPALIAIDNSDGRLRPGMNGSVSVWVERRQSVVAVPNEAIRNVNETAALAQVIKVDPESLKANVDSQVAALGRPTFQPTSTATPAAAVGGGGGNVDLNAPDLQQQQQGGQRGGGQQGGQPGGRQGGGRGAQPTEAQCNLATLAIGRDTSISRKVEELRTKQRSPELDQAARAKLSLELQALYVRAKVPDTAIARRCATPTGGRGGAGGGRGGAGGRGGGRGGNAGRGGGGGGEFTGQARNVISRNGLVFIVPADGMSPEGVPTKFEPRVIRLGLGSYEFTEVLEGLREGEVVANLNAAIIALQQEQARERMKQAAGGNPLSGGGGNPGGGMPRGGGGPGGGGGGGRGGGGGGGRGGN